MHDLPLRILLVLALAMWSPAWCCCALGAAADGDAEVAAFCHGRWAGVASGIDASDEAEQAAEAHLPPCCQARTLDRAAPDRTGADRTDDDEDHDRGCCDDDSPCNCGERPNEITRLDTAGKVTMPTFERIELLGVWADFADQARRSHVAVYVDTHAHPAEALSRTLFAQRCLLLT